MSHIEKALEKAKRERAANKQQPMQAEETPTADLVYTHTRSVPVDESVMVQNRLAILSADPVIVERYNMLKTRILQRTRDEHLNVLMITSVGPGEGKTLTAVNLAISIAREVAQSVLLVDADLRASSVHSYLGIPGESGLADYLFRDRPLPELLVNPGIAKLTVLAAGKTDSYHALEYLASPRMRNLVAEMKDRYHDRYIIFDCPPLLGVADALVFSTYVDGIVLVVEAGTTSEGDVRKAMDMLSDRPVLGTVLNRAEETGKKYGAYHYPYYPYRSAKK